ncbi:hypothetical protein V496_09396, partial [Pseudogymnoascus sp. VKM F-4515 (FW-2607)]
SNGILPTATPPPHTTTHPGPVASLPDTVHTPVTACVPGTSLTQ